MKYLEEVRDLLRKIEPIINDQNVNLLWYLHLLSKDKKDFFYNRNILRLLADKKAQINHKDEIRLPPPSDKDKLNGEIKLGDIIYPDKVYHSFGINKLDLIKHVLIAGITGSGKTNLSFLILDKLSKLNIPFLIFDWKRSYRNLKQLNEFKDITVIRLGDKECDFRFNPLIPPPGVDPKHWLALITDVIKHAFFIAHGGEYFFRKGIDSLYKRNKVYEGSKNYPTFRMLEKLLLNQYVKGREMLWMSSVKRVLSSLTFTGLLGDHINCFEQTNLETLFKGQIIIELDNLATIEKIFIVEALLLWIYHYRKNLGKSETLNQVIILEEAHHTLSAKKEYMSGEETILETIIRMIREFGIGIIAIDQEPSKLSNSIMANTNTKICFTLGHGNDITAMAKAMNLSKAEIRFIDKLDVGHAIVKLKSQFTEPVHTHFPLFQLNKATTTNTF